MENGVCWIGKWSGKCCRGVWRMDSGECSVESEDNGAESGRVECKQWRVGAGERTVEGVGSVFVLCSAYCVVCV